MCTKQTWSEDRAKTALWRLCFVVGVNGRNRSARRPAFAEFVGRERSVLHVFSVFTFPLSRHGRHTRKHAVNVRTNNPRSNGTMSSLNSRGVKKKKKLRSSKK